MDDLKNDQILVFFKRKCAKENFSGRMVRKQFFWWIFIEYRIIKERDKERGGGGVLRGKNFPWRNFQGEAILSGGGARFKGII
jgi:hypothetical protein